MDKRRILAIIALIGFVALIMYIAFLGKYVNVAIFIYLIVIAIFIATGGLSKNQKDKVDMIDLKIGKRKVVVEIPTKKIIGVLRQNDVQVSSKDEDSVREALENPIGAAKLRETVTDTDKIVIITSDITRPMPTKKVLPVVVEELSKAGVKDENITVVFALGSHRKHTDEEKKELVGEKMFERLNCIDSDVKDVVHLGNTSNGTPVDIFRPVTEADKVICLGNIEYHYFAGYSGGAKAIMPGVSSREAIQANHSKMLMDEAKTGNITGNPVRDDIEEAISIQKIDYIVNVVLSEKKEIIKTVAGHFVEAHRVGCEFLDSIYKIEIPDKADIVIASPGGFPKDINMYQAQKALDNAAQAVKKGGVVILVASCSEGYGEGVFERWINESRTPNDLIDRIKVQFELGGHKAAAIATVLEDADIYIVSDLENSVVENIYMKPYASVKDALKVAFDKTGADAKVIVMPSGGSTLPVLK